MTADFAEAAGKVISKQKKRNPSSTLNRKEVKSRHVTYFRQSAEVAVYLRDMMADHNLQVTPLNLEMWLRSFHREKLMTDIKCQLA